MNLKEQISRIKEVMKLNENNQTYPYSCAMLYFGGEQMSDLHNQIDPQDLYVEGDGFGIEKNPHCTLLYGLHDNEVTPQQIQDVIGKREFNTCRAHNLSLFENPKFDVLKYDIDGGGLHETNEDLKQFPFTTDYPDYHPHMTIAYIKSGKGMDYVNKFGGSQNEIYMTPSHVVYSRTDGSKHDIPIRLV